MLHLESNVLLAGVRVVMTMHICSSLAKAVQPYTGNALTSTEDMLAGVCGAAEGLRFQSFLFKRGRFPVALFMFCFLISKNMW